MTDTTQYKIVSQKSDPELVGQYIEMRSNNSSGHLPNEPIAGDKDAKFLIAVEGDKVRAGMRLSEVKGYDDEEHKKDWIPVDKVPGARVEALFPNNPEIAKAMRNKDGGYKILYVDGIGSNYSVFQKLFAGKVQVQLLTELAKHAKSENYAMVYCFPKDNGNARSIKKIYERQDSIAIDLGPQPYKGHDGSLKGDDRSLLIFTSDPNLAACLRKDPPELRRAGAREI